MFNLERIGLVCVLLGEQRITTRVGMHIFYWKYFLKIFTFSGPHRLLQEGTSTEIGITIVLRAADNQ